MRSFLKWFSKKEEPKKIEVIEVKVELTTVEQLNLLVNPLLEEIEKDLNRWSLRNKLETEVPIIPCFGPGEGPTKVPHSADAFSLNNAAPTGLIEMTNNGYQILVRKIISYTAINEMLKDESKVREILLPVLKQMVNELVRAKGYGPDKLNSGVYGTFKRPGKEFIYFRDLEDAAGAEIRLYGYGILCEK